MTSLEIESRENEIMCEITNNFNKLGKATEVLCCSRKEVAKGQVELREILQVYCSSNKLQGKLLNGIDLTLDVTKTSLPILISFCTQIPEYFSQLQNQFSQPLITGADNRNLINKILKRTEKILNSSKFICDDFIQLRNIHETAKYLQKYIRCD
jgi:site-specific DNA-adenine methylase